MADVTLPDNATAATQVAEVTVRMSDDSPFTGTLSVASNGMATISGNNIVLARNLTPADVPGSPYTWTITARQDPTETSIDAQIEVIPVPTAVNFDPDSAELADNTEAGFHISEASVTMSDGSVFNRGLVVLPPHNTIVTMVGTSLRTARQFVPNDVGTHTWTVQTQ